MIKVRLFDKKASRSYDFGIVKQVNVEYVSALTAMPMVVFGPKRALVMDSGGVSKSYRLSFTRVSPAKPSAVNLSDTSGWSNKEWRKDLKGALSRWQMRENGFTFTIEMDSESRGCFPDMTDNVYVNSISLPISNSTNTAIEGSIVLTVGSIRIGEASPVKMLSVRYHANYMGADPAYFDSAVPKKPSGEAVITLARPNKIWIAEQLKSKLRFSNWSLSSPGSTDRYAPGDIINTGSDARFYANWAPPYKHTLITATSGHVSPFKFGARTKYAIIVAIGAGGGGGLQHIINTSNPKRMDVFGGGGGNGGQWAVGEIDMCNRPIQVIDFVLGKGGRGASRSSPYDPSKDYSGAKGGDTLIPFIGLRGKGGLGGVYTEGSSTPGQGNPDGPEGTLGGSGAIVHIDGTIRNVVQEATEGEGRYGGLAGASGTAGAGGGGGGSPDIADFIDYFENSPELPCGGHGEDRSKADAVPATNGRIGGGGGGGVMYSEGTTMYSADGGDGAILVVEFDE